MLVHKALPRKRPLSPSHISIATKFKTSRLSLKPVKMEMRMNLSNPCQIKHQACRHKCSGVAGEANCLPCLEIECAALTQTSNKFDFCRLCVNGYLSNKPCVKLQCGHIVHANCLLEMLEARWTTNQITFDFLKCPYSTCKYPIRHLPNYPPI